MSKNKMYYVKISYRTWKVYSGDNEYLVTLDYRGWHCDGPDYNIRKRICKHCKLVKEGENIK